METEKKLLRPRDGIMIGGVCAAFARFFGVDVTLVRIGWVVLVLLLGTGILAYLICWVVIPQEDTV
jgi:phage shock protein C